MSYFTLEILEYIAYQILLLNTKYKSSRFRTEPFVI